MKPEPRQEVAGAYDMDMGRSFKEEQGREGKQSLGGGGY